MGVFTGLGDFVPKGSTGGDASKFRHRIFHAHVLDVVIDQNSQYYEEPYDIGKIRFRDLANSHIFSQKLENEIATFAYPLDRTVVKLPLPGEQVIIFKAIGDVKREATEVTEDTYFYSFVVSNTHNATFNSEPFLANDEKSVARPAPPVAVASKRFITKLVDDKTFKEGGNTTKIYKHLKPYEGDFILQGRFGQSIRFSSSTQKSGATRPWTDGQAGDPIMTLRVEKEHVTTQDQMYTEENFDTDDAIVSLSSNQGIPAKLSCTLKMKTWEYTFAVEKETGPAGVEQALKYLKAPAGKVEIYKPKNVQVVVDYGISSIDQISKEISD